KLPGYILPVFPALALIIGAEIEAILKSVPTIDRGLLIATAVVLIILGIGLCYFAGKEFHTGIDARLALLAIPLVIALSLIFACWRQQRNHALISLALLNPLLAIVIVTTLFSGIEEKASLAPIARIAAREMKVNEELIFFNFVQYSPFFYTNGRIVKGI